MKLFPLYKPSKEEQIDIVFPLSGGKSSSLSKNHIVTAETVSKSFGKPVWFEMSILNENGKKDQLLNITHRMIDFANFGIENLIVTETKKIYEKARIFPGSYIVLSLPDFVTKVLKDSFFVKSAECMDILKDINVKLLVMTLKFNDKIISIENIKLPNHLYIKENFVRSITENSYEQ